VTLTVNIVPVRKSVEVQADAARAFEIFVLGIDDWWPKGHRIGGSSPVIKSVIEPFLGGRWYSVCEDGSEICVGHIRAWEPGRRAVFSWEFAADWKPDATSPSEVEINFIALDEKTTRVELEHRDFERMGKSAGEKMRTDVAGGWPDLMERYAKAVSPEAN
jgi:uncharacterized protein YndB with AHSA1/START domain